MTATYTVVSSPAPSGRKSSKSNTGSYNKALKGYMCDLEKRYGRIPLSPDNARIPLSLSVGGGHQGMYWLNGGLHMSPCSSKSSRGQSRWSNASPVSSTNASAVHLSSPHDSFANSSLSSHNSLHSHMDGSDRFAHRSVMEDSLPTPPIASSSRRFSALEYDDGEVGDYDDFRAVPPIYDDDYRGNGQEKQTAPRRGSATGRSNTNRSRPSTSSSSSSSPRTRRNRTEKSQSRSHAGHSSWPPSSASSKSSICRWEALVDDSSHRRGSHSCVTKEGGSDSGRERDPSTLSPTKPSRSESLIVDTLTEAVEIASTSAATSKNRKLNRSKSGSNRSDSNRRRGSRNSSSSSSSSRSRLVSSSSFNAKAPIREEDKDRVISPPKRSNSSSPRISTKAAKGGSGGSSKKSNSSRRSESSSRRVPDVFLQSPY